MTAESAAPRPSAATPGGATRVAGEVASRRTAPAVGRARRPQSDEAPARVWAVPSRRAGETSQVEGLATQLGVPFVVKQLDYGRLAGPTGLLRRVSLRGLTPASRAQLGPPWPDLIISARVTNEPVCRWIKRASGGRTRLVFLGRTWAPRASFDLVITTPQYRLPREPNVLHNLMTQHGITPATLRAAERFWARRFEAFARPRIGVLVGGDSGPYVLGRRAARRLAAGVNALRLARGGSVLVTTSARTRHSAAEKLGRSLVPPAFVYRWRPDDPENPYLGILALSDELVVTSDSVAMLSEAAATGRPVHVFDLDAGLLKRDHSLKASAYALMMRVLPQRLSRDLTIFHRAFIAGGHGVRLGESPPRPPASAAAEVEATLGRVRALLRPPG